MKSRVEHHRWISSNRRRVLNGTLAVTAALLSAATALRSQDTAAYTYSVLYTFNGGTDGGEPYASLVRDRKGNLYGTTSLGGNLSVSCDYNPGCGVVFKLDPGGKEKVLYAFTGGADGGSAVFDSALILDEESNLYGTMAAGGDLSECGGTGCGVVFKVDPAGKETVLYRFTGGADGSSSSYDPTLVRDRAGNLYGTTFAGGNQDSGCLGYGPGCGVVYSVDPAGNESVLYAFKGGRDGQNPNPCGPLVWDKAGNLYGTVIDGPVIAGKYYAGKIFKLNPAGKETVLYTFTGGTDGGQPWAGMIRDNQGNLYGTTAAGGIAPSPSGSGVVFKLDKTGKETVLYTFTGGADGGGTYARLVRDSAGNLFGTTPFGGDFGFGVVYKVDPSGHETVLHSFTGGSDGGSPDAGLILDNEGNLYSTTVIGGNLSGCFGNGCGVVFKLTRSTPGGQ